VARFTIGITSIGLPDGSTEAREGRQGNKKSIVSRFLRNVNELPSRKSYLNRKTYINNVHNGVGGRIGMIRATGFMRSVGVDGAKP
jgi:hypothetical protein